MATAKTSAGRALPRRGKRWRQLGWMLVLAAAVFALLYGRGMVRQAEAGAAYGARMGCSCRFVAGRPLGACRADFEPGMRLVMLSEDADTRSVTARVPLVATETAHFRDGYGCVLERWTD